MSKIPTWHYPMLNDSVRNMAFRQAIQKQIDERHRVLDIGTGSGLLSVFAYNSGASTIDAFEAHDGLVEVAAETFQREALTERIVLHGAESTRVQFHATERRNALITEIFDCGLIGEGIIPTLRHARRHLLTDEYVAIPRSAVLSGALVRSTEIRRLNEVSVAAGVDVSHLNCLATSGHFPIRLRTWKHDIVSEEQAIFSIDMSKEFDPRERYQRTFKVLADGMVDGVVAWFDMDLGAGESISTRMGNSSHWMQAYIGFPAPIQVSKSLDLEVQFHIEDEKSIKAEPHVVSHVPPKYAAQVEVVQ